MTYPPGSPGYPPAQQPTTQFAAPTQQFSTAPESGAPEGGSKLPAYLLALVAVLGLAVYLFHFGPLFTITTEFPGLGTATGSSLGLGLAVVAAILAGLLAGVNLLPKQGSSTGVVAVIATVAFLLVIGELVNKPSAISIGWALYVIIACTVLQAGAAIAALLLETGVLPTPAAKPRYDQQYGQYGQYGAPGQYYGQPPGQPQGQPPGQSRHQQRPGGYPSHYGSYPGGPSTGGFSSTGAQNGPPTPPTGFPAFGQPSSPPSSPAGRPPSSAQPQPSSSQQSDQEPS